MSKGPLPQARELLGPNGPLARALPAYETREGQLEMAAAVERALEEDGVLFVEAGTGTGKTLAYLVPAILSGKKVVVSTATRALQEQIVAKDLPLIRDLLGLEPRAALMKGLGNYLCLRRYQELRTSSEGLAPSRSSALAELEKWALETETGDVGELAALGEDDPIWRDVTASSDTRMGPLCPHFSECFVTRMKRDADAARLVIVNHHLFFADLALRGPHPGRVIPDYDAVIFDEAHQLEDIATAFFSVRVSSLRLSQLLRELERAVTRAGLGDVLLAGGGGPQLLGQARRAAEGLWQRLHAIARSREGRSALDRDFWIGEPLEAWHVLDGALEGLGAYAEATRGRLVARLEAGDAPPVRDAAGLADAFEIAGRRVEALRRDFSTIIEGAPGRVVWVEAARRGTVLSSSPVDLSGLLRERLFETVPAVVLTSATLASGTGRARRSGEAAASGPFSFLRRRLGADGDLHVAELVLPSPFDFESRALLYVPKDLPSPREPEFTDEAASRVADLLEITGGGAFVLTTSFRSMHALHRGLRAHLPGRRLLLQGEAPKGTLLGAFKAAGDAVLVATLGFWQGVDVPGPALRLVVLEKIPFAVPTDPIAFARAEAVEAEGGSAFMEFQVPLAKIALKQGFGRLIRSGSDYGVVALLDARVHSKGYGRRLLSALPPARLTAELDEVRAFWSALPVYRESWSPSKTP